MVVDAASAATSLLLLLAISTPAMSAAVNTTLGPALPLTEVTEEGVASSIQLASVVAGSVLKT